MARWTLVVSRRAVLVPAVMKIVGDWNWYLPARVRRVLRVPAGPARATE